MQFSFSAPLWLYPGKAAWYLVTLPAGVSDEIEEAASGRTRGFGSVPVTVTVGATTWSTSLFPSKREAAYILPVKKQVRDAEQIVAGGEVVVTLVLA